MENIKEKLSSLLKEGHSYNSNKLPQNTFGYLKDHPLEFDAWVQRVKMLISRSFSTDSSQYTILQDGLQSYEDLRDFRTPNAYDNTNKKLLNALEIAIDSIDNDRYDEIVFQKNVGSDSKISQTSNKIFIGHGKSKLWARLQLFIKDELGVETVSYESESRVGESIVPILEKILCQSTFAVLVLTAEDQTEEGNKRARQNVIHEAGLFQGRLGFDKAILLVQQGLEGFTNIDGLQYIPFSDENIEETFYQLQRTLKQKGIINT